jgi:hypothetical protein
LIGSGLAAKGDPMREGEKPRREFLERWSATVAVRQHRRLTPGQQLKK